MERRKPDCEMDWGGGGGGWMHGGWKERERIPSEGGLGGADDLTSLAPWLGIVALCYYGQRQVRQVSDGQQVRKAKR